MVRITRVYTRKGDKGSTQVSKSVRLSKNSVRVEVLGLLDELNSYLGWVMVLLNDDGFAKLKAKLIIIQQTLFDVGAIICQPEKKNKFVDHLTSLVQDLEADINLMNTELPTLDSFILPGGSELSARLHIARTVCRRMECKLVALVEENHISFLLPYINRLSDWLFVAARFSTNALAIPELLWTPWQ